MPVDPTQKMGSYRGPSILGAAAVGAVCLLLAHAAGEDIDDNAEGDAGGAAYADR